MRKKSEYSQPGYQRLHILMQVILTKVAEDLVRRDCRPDVQTYQGLGVSFC